MDKKILIIEDEKNIVDILKFNLKKEGFETLEAYDGEQGLEMAISEDPDLVLLDIMLPRMDGFTVCRKLRQTSMVPVIMLTAREEEVDKVLGLELGADDYITKPFSQRELLARIKANLRRSAADGGSSGADSVTGGGSGSSRAKTATATNIMKFEDILIDPDRYEVRRNGKVIELTLREFELVKFLAMHRGQIFSRESLLQKVWGYEYFGDVRTVDVTVRRIRMKLEKDAENEEYILTKRGVGYYFNNDPGNG